MPVLVSVALFFTMTNTLLWDLPGDVLAAPEAAMCGWKGVNICVCVSLSGWNKCKSSFSCPEVKLERTGMQGVCNWMAWRLEDTVAVAQPLCSAAGRAQDLHSRSAIRFCPTLIILPQLPRVLVQMLASSDF